VGNGSLLIVSHALVSVYDGRLFTGSGLGRHVDALAMHFDRVYLLTCAEGVDRLPDKYVLRAPNVTLVAVPDYMHRWRLVRYLLTMPTMVAAAIRFVQVRNKVDILHPRLPSVVGSVGAFLARFTEKPVFLYLAGDWEALFRDRGYLERAFGHVVQWHLRFLVDGQLCFTAGETLARKFNGPNARVIPVYTTSIEYEHIVNVAEAERRARRFPEELLFVGGVTRAKGIDVLLEALALLLRRGMSLRLRIVGEAPDGGRWLMREARTLGIADRIEYHPPIAWDRLMRLYSQSHICVLPSRSEGIPKVLLEAMAQGLPVVATAVGGIPELVDDGENGLLVPVGNARMLANAVERLVTDVHLRETLVRQGVKTARSRTLSHLVENIVGTVREYYGLGGGQA